MTEGFAMLTNFEKFCKYYNINKNDTTREELFPQLKNLADLDNANITSSDYSITVKDKIIKLDDTGFFEARAWIAFIFDKEPTPKIQEIGDEKPNLCYGTYFPFNKCFIVESKLPYDFYEIYISRE